jgi:hypothetical protein
MNRPRSGDYAWGTIIVAAVVYELIADDLLSVAADRYRVHSKWLVRLVLLAVGGHLGGALPPWADVFYANNIAHRAIKRLYRRVRP